MLKIFGVRPMRWVWRATHEDIDPEDFFIIAPRV